MMPFLFDRVVESLLCSLHERPVLCANGTFKNRSTFKIFTQTHIKAALSVDVKTKPIEARTRIAFIL